MIVTAFFVLRAGPAIPAKFQQSSLNPFRTSPFLLCGGAVASSDIQRKLTAILVSDVVGYSRLMGADEEATIETLTAYRKVFSSYIAQYRGRVVNAPGDSILAVLLRHQTNGLKSSLGKNRRTNDRYEVEYTSKIVIREVRMVVH